MYVQGFNIIKAELQEEQMTSVLHTDGHTNGHRDTRTDGLIPVYPRKHYFAGV